MRRRKQVAHEGSAAAAALHAQRGAAQGAGRTLSSAAIEPIGSASPVSKPALSSSTALPPAPAMSSAPAPRVAAGASAVLPAPGRREARASAGDVRDSAGATENASAETAIAATPEARAHLFCESRIAIVFGSSDHVSLYYTILVIRSPW